MVIILGDRSQDYLSMDVIQPMKKTGWQKSSLICSKFYAI